MRAKATSSGKIYFYYDCGPDSKGVRKWKSLGSNFVDAVRQWSELECAPADVAYTFREAAEEYFKSAEFRQKAPRTQSDYLHYAENLYEYFDDPPAPLDAIDTHHVQKYHERRSKTALTRANREIAFFSIVWNFARRMGYTSKANPKPGVRRNTERGRDVYVYDEIFDRVLAAADACTRDTLELAYLLGQRPADVFKLAADDVTAVLDVRQNKTDASVSIELSAALQVVLARCTARRTQTGARCTQLLVNETGKAFTQSMFRTRFDALRKTLGISKQEFQLRDMRSKAATDVRDTRSLEDAQKLLGHDDVRTTQHYTKRRRGMTVKPTR